MNFQRKIDGTTALMAACARLSAPMVGLLVDLQCNTRSKDVHGLTARHHVLRAAAILQQRKMTYSQVKN